MVRFTLTLALSPLEREQDFWLPSPQGEGLGMRAIHTCIQQRRSPTPKVLELNHGFVVQLLYLNQ